MLDTDKLAAETTKRGWKQTELAKRAGMTPQQWNNIASGLELNPRLWTVQRVAKAIGCCIDQIINDSEPPTTKTKQGRRSKGR